MQNLVSKCHAN